MNSYDGLANEFFYMLNEKQKDTGDQAQFSFRIPDTIIFKFHEPINWFFRNKKGEFLRKQTKNISVESLKRFFFKKEKKSGIYALFLEVDPITRLNKVTYYDKPTLGKQ